MQHSWYNSTLFYQQDKIKSSVTCLYNRSLVTFTSVIEYTARDTAKKGVLSSFFTLLKNQPTTYKIKYNATTATEIKDGYNTPKSASAIILIILSNNSFITVYIID